MPLHVETNEPATEDDLQRVEAALGAPLPAALRAFLLRHDGLQTYAENDALGWIVHGADAARIARDGALARSPDGDEFRAYARDAYAAAPLVAETASFRDWLSEAAPVEPGAFPDGFVCVAAHWVHQGTCWLPLRADASELFVVPSPRASSTDAVAEGLDGPRIAFDAFIARLLAGDEPL